MRKGFTLIELLAVIVILSVILLITIPRVYNIVKNSKEKNFVICTENYIRAVEDALYTKNINDEFSPGECDIKEDGNLLCDIGQLEVETGGSRPKDGILYLVNNQVKRALNIKYEETDKYITKDTSNSQCTLTDEYEPVPNLMSSSLTPVRYQYDETKEEGNWIIANLGDKWYDYNKQEWANAVILTEEAKNTKQIGDIITVEGEDPDVIGMFVWIPRYSYTIKNGVGVQLEGGSTPTTLTPGAIDIKFVSKNMKDDGIPKYTKNTPSGWYTHPAFTFGDEELRGLWFGKFETTGTEYMPTVLPEHISIGNSNFKITKGFNISLKFNDYVSGDSHMAKNSEWAAVAYLSQSKYGKYGNVLYTGNNKEIYANDSKKHYTGKSLGTVHTSTPPEESNCSYDDIKDRKDGTGSCGGGASTTGNIYGIYDMAGGCIERVMANYDNKIPVGSGDTIFNEIDSKYYDLYTNTNAMLEACNGKICYGHAFSEIRDWYVHTSSAYFDDSRSVLLRGNGVNTVNTSIGSGGIFSSMTYNGNAGTPTFRVVIS